MSVWSYLEMGGLERKAENGRMLEVEMCGLGGLRLWEAICVQKPQEQTPHTHPILFGVPWKKKNVVE